MFLPGGNIGATDNHYTETVPQTIGAACKEYSGIGYWCGKVYTEKSGNEYPLWKQDKDDDLFDQKEKAYRILVGPAGTYSVKGKTLYHRVTSVFDNPIYWPFTTSTNLGIITVEGGKVKIYL